MLAAVVIFSKASERRAIQLPPCGRRHDGLKNSLYNQTTKKTIDNLLVELIS